MALVFSSDPSRVEAYLQECDRVDAEEGLMSADPLRYKTFIP